MVDMTTNTASLTAARRDVLLRAINSGFADDTVGEVNQYGLIHQSLMDFYGRDYIVTTNSLGEITVESFETTFTDERGTWRSAECGNRMVDYFDAYGEWAGGFFGDDEMGGW